MRLVCISFVHSFFVVSTVLSVYMSLCRSSVLCSVLAFFVFRCMSFFLSLVCLCTYFCIYVFMSLIIYARLYFFILFHAVSFVIFHYDVYLLSVCIIALCCACLGFFLACLSLTKYVGSLCVRCTFSIYMSCLCRCFCIYFVLCFVCPRIYVF